MGVLIGIKHDQLKGLYQYINVHKKKSAETDVLLRLEDLMVALG